MISLSFALKAIDVHSIVLFIVTFISNSNKKIHTGKCEAKLVIYTILSQAIRVETTEEHLFSTHVSKCKMKWSCQVFCYKVHGREGARRGDRNFGGSKGGICKDFRKSLSKIGLELLFHHLVNEQY